jgi:phosphoribosylformylglycinamidine synthase
MESFARAVDGLAAACKTLGVPIVSGNVSLYNETVVTRAGGEPASLAILPTPSVAAVGLVASLEDVVTASFKRAGDVILLLGESAAQGVRALAASEWLVQRLGKLTGEGPAIDLAAEAKLQALVLELARSHRLASAHDVSDGGLAANLAESCTTGADLVGARIELPSAPSPVDGLAALFGEAPSRVVVSVRPEHAAEVLAKATAAGVPARRIGETGGDVLAIAVPPIGSLSVSLAEVKSRREACLRPVVGD